MPPQARIGDLAVGYCICHPSPIPMVGILVTGSPDTITNSLPTSRLTDVTISACGHPGLMVTSSGVAFVNSLGAVRLGDVFAGCFNGLIVTGSPDTITG